MQVREQPGKGFPANRKPNLFRIWFQSELDDIFLFFPVLHSAGSCSDTGMAQLSSP